MGKGKRKNPPFVLKNVGYKVWNFVQVFDDKKLNPKQAKGTFGRIDSSFSNEYQQLSAIHVDLRFCENACNKMLEITKALPEGKRIEGQPDHLALVFDEARAAMFASIICYARCFGAGTRLKLQETEIWQAGDHALKAHEYFMTVRSKFVAHAVNDFEDVGVAVHYLENGEEASVVGVADAFISAAMPNKYLLSWLIRLSKQSQKHVEDRIDALRENIIRDTNNLDSQQIRSLPSLTTKAGSYNAPKKSKKT